MWRRVPSRGEPGPERDSPFNHRPRPNIPGGAVVADGLPSGVARKVDRHLGGPAARWLRCRSTRVHQVRRVDRRLASGRLDPPIYRRTFLATPLVVVAGGAL